MSKTRTFVAVAISDDMRERALAAIDVLRPAAGNIKWVSAENLHWTLQFLGDVDDAEVFEVCRRVAEVAAEHEFFSLNSMGVGAFPSNDRPRALWLGAEQGSDALEALQDDIEESLSEVGFRGERRRFVPHLTIGRVGRGSHGSRQLSEKLSTLAGFDGGAMTVEEVTVFGSELKPEGPTYHVLSRAPLAGLS